MSGWREYIDISATPETLEAYLRNEVESRGTARW